MNSFQFIKSSWNDISELMQQYLQSLSNYPDGFWDDLLYEADIYVCLDDTDKTIGFFAIGDAWDGGKSIRALYLQREYIINAQTIYSKIVAAFDIVSAMVLSGDEQHVCLAFEKMHELKGSFDMQAYNLVYGDSLIPPKYDMSYFSVVTEDEYSEMDKLTENRWKNDRNNPNNIFYSIKENGKILGYGSVFPHKLDTRCISIGNFVLPEHRQKGVGRSIIINLCNEAKKNGLIPTEGCWYYNHESIATLKSSGYIPTSRLFYVKFLPEQTFTQS